MEVTKISDNLKITEITNEPFKFSVHNLHIIKESVDPDDPNKPIRFEGQASTTQRSSSKHKMNEPAIQKMKDNCLNLPMFWDHDESRRAAAIIGVKQTGPNEFWPIGETAQLTGNPVLDAPIQQVKRDLEDPNCQVGMSVGGIIIKARFVEDLDTYEWWIEIDDIDLYEVSLTTIPALDSTKGKTKILNSCKGSICSQIVADIKQNLNSPVNEALMRLEQKVGENIKKPSEVMNMTEKIEVNKTEWDEMKESLKITNEYIKQDIEAKKLAEKEAEEVAAREEMKQSVKEEVISEFTKEVLPKLAESTKDALEQRLAAVTGERTHVQQSAQGTPKDAPATLKQIKTPETDPKSSIALGQKCVVLGQTVEGYTPTEYFNH